LTVSTILFSKLITSLIIMNSWNRFCQLWPITTIVGANLAIGLMFANSSIANTLPDVNTLPAANAQSPSQSKSASKSASELAWQYAYQKDYEASLKILNQLIQANPDQETWQLQRAEILSWAKRYRESIQAYQQIRVKNPQLIAATIGHAEVLSWDGQYDQSLRIYQQVLSIDPKQEKALTGVAHITFWKGDLADALTQFTQLRQQFPQSTVVQLGLAKTYIARQEIKPAKAILETLIAAKNADAIVLAKDINAVQSATEFTSRSRSSQQNNLTVNQTVKFRVGDSNTQQSVQVGYGKFTQPGREVLNTTPVRIGIEGTNYPTKWQLSAGVDLFDRLSAQPFLEGKVTTQINPNLQVGATANYQAYKENVATLENGIKRLQIQPHVYWRMTPSTSLYAQYGAGFYSDGNRDGQLWAGLKQELGNFYVEGSVLSWRYAKDPKNGYFAPSDYFSYAGELGWQGRIADPATCQLALSIGRQSYDGQSRPANGYKAGCKLELSPTTSLDAQYRYSSSALFTGAGTSSNEHRVEVNLKTQF
jgi:tetratricopeptide (TPR) repeat protein